MKLIDGLWVWWWWWSQSYLFGETRVGETAAPVGRWIPILWMLVLFHDVFGSNNVVYTEVWYVGGSLYLGRFL